MTLPVTATGSAPDRPTDDSPDPALTPLDSVTVNRLGWGIVVVSAVVRALVTATGFFYWDDFILQGRAARLPLNLDFLTRTHDGHLMPAALLVSWLTERIAPLQFWLPAVTMVLLQAAISVSGWLLLRRIFGPRPLVLVPLVVLVTSALTLPSAVWWSAALNALPYQLGLLAVTYGAWLLERTERTRAGMVWSVAGIIGALAFFEKGLLLGIWLPLAMWLFSELHTCTGWLRHQWRQRRRFWLGLAILALAYGLLYRTLSDRGPRVPAALADFTESVRLGIVEGLFPAIVGGPTSWGPVGSGAAISHPPSWLIWASCLLVLSLVALGCWGSPVARRAWIAAGAYILIAIAIFDFARSGGMGGPLALLSLRYTADAVLPMALAIGLSLMPLRGVPASARQRRLRQLLATRPRSVSWGATGAAVAAVLLWGTSVLGFWGIWSTIPARDWLANARTTMAQGASEGPIITQAVPEYVLYGLANPYHLADWVLAPLSDRPAFADFTNAPRYLLSNGRLVPGAIEGINARPGPDGSCGWKLRPGTNVIPLVSDVFEWEHRVELDYLAGEQFPAAITLGSGTPTKVQFERGLGRLVLRTEGGGRSVTITGIPAGVGVCVSRVAVGGWVEVDPARR